MNKTKKPTVLVVLLSIILLLVFAAQHICITTETDGEESDR